MVAPANYKMTDIETPSLYEVSQMAQDAGLEGEQDTHLVVFISTIRGGFVWMRSPSRSGKDEVVDAVEYCLPNGGGFSVFKVPSSSSKTALFKKAAEMNSKKIHRYPDISSLPEHLESILKKHGDGQPITHELATGTDAGETEKQTIDPPDAFILFHASDNEKVDPDDYPELRNRALMVSVDASEGLTRQVNTRQAQEEAGLYEQNVPSKREQEIRNYIRTIPKDIYIDGLGSIQNPVAPAIDNQNPLPQKFVEARQDFPRLLKFMKSITLFHHKERMKITSKDGKPLMLVSPTDAYLAMRVFGQDMVLSALNLRTRDLKTLDFLRSDMQEGMSKSEIQQELRAEGLNVTERDVQTSLDGMLNKGYVRKDQSTNPVMWSATPFASQVSADVSMDWEEIVSDTQEVANKALPDDDAQEYIERFCKGDGLLCRDPFKGSMVNITESNELEAEVEERMEMESDSLDQGYGDTSDNEQEEEVMGGQVDLNSAGA